MMSSHSWLFAPKSKWDKQISLAHLVRMVSPTEMALILAMTEGFPERIKRKMVDMMIRRYLTLVCNAMKSKVFSKIKVLKIMSLSIFMTYDTDHCCPLLDDLTFRWLYHNYVKPKHLEHVNLPSFPFLFRIKYMAWYNKKEYELVSLLLEGVRAYAFEYPTLRQRYIYETVKPEPIKDDEEPIIDDEKPIYDYKELLRLVKPKMVVSVKKKDRFPPQKKLTPPRKFSSKGGW